MLSSASSRSVVLILLVATFGYYYWWTQLMPHKLEELVSEHMTTLEPETLVKTKVVQQHTKLDESIITTTAKSQMTTLETTSKQTSAVTKPIKLSRLELKARAAEILFCNGDHVPNKVVPSNPMVFLHNHKAAGSTMRGTLHYHWMKSNNSFLIQEEPEVWPSLPKNEDAGSRNIIKVTLGDFGSLENNKKMKQPCDRCYFSVGRKPYERLVSLYHYRMCQGIYGKHTIEQFFKKRSKHLGYVHV